MDRATTKIKKILASFVLASVVLFIVFPLVTEGVITLKPQVPVPGMGQDAKGEIEITPLTLATYINTIYNFLLVAAGILATVMIVWGGFIWLTARGNASQVEKGQEYLKNAIMGLVLLFGAYIILSFLNPKLTELKSLKVDKVTKVAGGFYCDERVAAMAKEKIDGEIGFYPIETQGQPSTIKLSNLKGDESSGWIASSTVATMCKTAYAVGQRTAGARQWSIVPGQPCFGRKCPNAGFVCVNVQQRFDCQEGFIVGTIFNPDPDKKVDAVALYFAMSDLPDKSLGVAELSTDKKDFRIRTSSFSWSGLFGGGLLATTLKVVGSPVLFWTYVGTEFALWVQAEATEFILPKIGNSFYIVLTMESAQGKDDFYFGRGGQRITFSSNDSKCYEVTSRGLTTITVSQECAQLLISGDDISGGKSIDLHLEENDNFRIGRGERNRNAWYNIERQMSQQDIIARENVQRQHALNQKIGQAVNAQALNPQTMQALKTQFFRQESKTGTPLPAEKRQLPQAGTAAGIQLVQEVAFLAELGVYEGTLRDSNAFPIGPLEQNQLARAIERLNRGENISTIRTDSSIGWTVREVESTFLDLKRRGQTIEQRAAAATATSTTGTAP